ncbi:MAG: flagellar biosynthesis protein FliQ [Stagnimonas sp.]|nr:flagellar biosynthesis protein FliQ [Stagnimonas sp.]
MTPDSALTLTRDAMWLALQLATPLLVASLFVGVLVGLFQAATQINEMTLSFIPKLLAMAAVALLFGPWMLQLLIDFTRRLFEQIPSLIG